MENLLTAARDTHLISTSELTAGQAAVERVGCFSNLHTYLGYKGWFSNSPATGPDRNHHEEKAGDETLSLPVKGAFIAVGLEPNSSLAARQYLLNLRKVVCV